MSPKPRFPRKGALALLLIVLAAFPAVAAGQRMDPLLRAEKLIEDRKYAEAKTYLTEFMRLYPERFDEALIYIRAIEQLQNEYTDLSNELLATMMLEPGNDEKILALIQRLEENNPNPNPTDKSTIVKLKETRLVVKNQDLMRRIMTTARAQIDSGDYVEAAKTYEGGLSLFQFEFQNAGYGEINVSAVGNLITIAREVIPEFDFLQMRLEPSVTALTRAYDSGDPQAVEAAWPAAERAMTDLARRRLEAYNSGTGLLAVAEVLPTEGKSVIEYSYMTYADLFIRGRPESMKTQANERGKVEGIAGAMLTQWTALMERLQAAAEPAVDRAFAAAEAAYDGARIAEAQTAFAAAGRLADPAIKTIGLWNLLTPTEVEPGLTELGRSIQGEKAAARERIGHLGATATAQARLAEAALAALTTQARALAFADRLSELSPLDSSLSALASFRAEIRGFASKIEAERAASAELALELGRRTLAGSGDERSTRAQGAFDGRLAAAAEALRGYEVALVARSGGFEYAALDREYAARRASSEQARLLIEGLPSEDPTLEGSLVRYPSRSAQLLAREESSLRALRDKISSYISKYRSEVSFVASAAPVAIWVERASLLDGSTRSLQTTGTTLLARAQEQMRQAEANRLRADELFLQAGNALGREDFESAKKSLDESGKRYLASLSYEDDAALRGSSGRELQRLGEEIVKAENDKVIRETRAFINTGKEAYFAADFGRAETAFLRGRERWRTTHNDDLKTEGVDEGKNSEVEYWLALVQTALTVKTGRDILPTAPLYPEMSQTLSLAMRYYEEGARLLARKDKAGALLAFSQARAKLNDVRLVYPLNQDAGILELRIDQLIDPDNFRQVFSQRLATARTAIRSVKTNPTAARDAYADIQNLYAIDPKYAGIKALVEEAEYALGIRIRAPDRTNITRAKELVAVAQRIYDAADTARFAFAIEQLNLALENDPNSQAAAELKDRIQTFQGGSAQLVLTPAAESQYQQAIALFQSGNYLGASAVVERLLLDPKNKRVQKLIDLYNQIKARI